jgi:hypothetical protein
MSKPENKEKNRVSAPKPSHVTDKGFEQKAAGVNGTL